MKPDDILKGAVVWRGCAQRNSSCVGSQYLPTNVSPQDCTVKVVKAQVMNDAPKPKTKYMKKGFDLSVSRKGLKKPNSRTLTTIARHNGEYAHRSNHFDSGQLSKKQRKSRRNTSMSVARFVEEHRREIGRFGSKALDKKDRRAYEVEDLARLGCRPPKQQKMPIGILQQKRKKEKEQLALKKQADLESGMLVRSRRRK